MLKTAIEILNIIKQNKYNAIIVGGFVRDYILNINSLDIDIATNMPITELKKLFDINDNKYGSFIINKNNFKYEITLFRKELSYNKQRHPEIELVDSFKEDYIRRDFTINALGMDSNMHIIDYADGKKDLSNKLIKTIRNPDITFKEDPVRIIRAIYFKNKINFKFENNTYESLIKNVKELSVISHKRVFMELEKMCINFSSNLVDLIQTNSYKYICDLKDTLLFIYENKLEINNIYEIFEIHYYFKNDLTKWDFSSIKKKEIKEIVDLINKELNDKFVFEVDYNKFILSNIIDKKINNKDRRKEYDLIKNKLLINKISDIDFNFKKLINYIEPKDIKVVKNNIIDLILCGKLKNKNEDIIIYIENYTKE